MEHVSLHMEHVSPAFLLQGSTLAVFRYPGRITFFAAIWGPDFRASTIILTHMFKQTKQIRITLMAMFKVNSGPPSEVR